MLCALFIEADHVSKKKNNKKTHEPEETMFLDIYYDTSKCDLTATDSAFLVSEYNAKFNFTVMTTFMYEAKIQKTITLAMQ